MCGTKLHIWTKLCGDWLKCATCISENVTISFTHEYRKPTLTSRCDVISDVTDIKNTLMGIISNDLSISEVKMNPGSCTGIWVIQQDMTCYSLHFELLIDAVAKLLQFQNLTYCLTS